MKVKGKDIERTLVIIKPDCIEKRLVGKVISRIEDLGLIIADVKSKMISSEECSALYVRTKVNLPEIYAAVEKVMMESPSIILVVEGEDAIRKVFELRGLTNLLQTPEGTIRRDFITDAERELFRQGKHVKNLMHAAEDKKEAEFEVGLFFGKKKE
ncbi:MAG: nucleoside-diphosphate kinase [Patescibacteria group bacterium]